MNPACRSCGTIHCGGDVVAIGRFRPEGPTGYRARGGELFGTRSDAVADLCNRRREARR